MIDSMEVGGAEAVVDALCRLHAAAGHFLEVHCLITGGPFADRLRADGIPVVVHPTTRWRSFSSLYREFRRFRPDVVHCHNKAATVRASAVSRLTGARAVISTRHGIVSARFRLRSDLKYWLTAATFCDRVVAVCETARLNMKVVARRVGHKIVTIRNGAFSLSSPGAPSLSKQGFTLVSVGRLAAVKDHATLLQAVALAKRTVPDLQLWIVGDGPERASLTALTAQLQLQDTVSFAGERHDVGTWLRHSDVFVLSSITEGMPMSVLEAMAAGLPTIATRVGGIPELIELSQAGTMIPARDPGGLAEAIIEFSNRRHELKQLGTRALRCYEEHFTPERMANDYLKLYQRFVPASVLLA